MESQHSRDDMEEGINAFATDDALKQEVNPTHAINPKEFGSDRKGMDFNSSRTLNEAASKMTPADYKFNTPTPMPRNARASEFSNGNKENVMFGKSPAASPMTTAREFVLQNTIDQANVIDESKAAASFKENNKTSISSMEIEDPTTIANQSSGTENRRQKRRKAKKVNAGGTQNIFSNGELM